MSVINYDRRELFSEDIINHIPAFMEYREVIAGPDLPPSWRTFIRKIDEKVLHHYYENFCRYAEEGIFINKDANEEKLLAKAVQKFCGLTKIHCFLNQDYRYFNRKYVSFDISSLSQAAQQILAEPSTHNISSNEVTHFWNLMKAVCQSDVRFHLSEIK